MSWEKKQTETCSNHFIIEKTKIEKVSRAAKIYKVDPQQLNIAVVQ